MPSSERFERAGSNSFSREAVFSGRFEKFTQERRQVRGIAVDSNETRYRDDAFWVEKIPGGGYEISVTVTDISDVIQKKDRLDSRASKNGSNKPMFPAELRDDKLCLKSGESRNSITVTVRLDDKFNTYSPRVELTRLQLERKEKLNYSHAMEALQKKDHEMHKELVEFVNIAANLRDKREKRGALIPTKFEGKRDRNGCLEVDNYNSRLIPGLMVEEFMLLANSSLTSYFTEKNIPLIFKNKRDVGDGAQGENKGIVASSFYSPIPEEHFYLKIPYARFTSPMHQYDALVNQRILVSHLHGEEYPYTPKELNDICRHLNENEVTPDEFRLMYGGHIQERRGRNTENRGESKEERKDRLNSNRRDSWRRRALREKGPFGKELPKTVEPHYENPPNPPKKDEARNGREDKRRHELGINDLNKIPVGREVTIETLVEFGIVSPDEKPEDIIIIARGGNLKNKVEIKGIPLSPRAAEKIYGRRTVKETPIFTRQPEKVGALV